MKKIGLIGLALCFVLGGGCSRLQPVRSAGRALFTRAAMSDLELVGVKSGPIVPLRAAAAGQMDDGTAEVVSRLLAEGPVGVLLPIERVGEGEPWWIFCPAGDLQRRCEEIPSNARVTFTGHPLGRGTVLLPTHLSWSAQ